ncbi:MAG TPA: hypothetical protein VMN82_16995 [Thermoanaerobaculia bacterium]|nr:hypothetical protein [Thermoanaerobaculia bacterium]
MIAARTLLPAALLLAAQAGPPPPVPPPEAREKAIAGLHARAAFAAPGSSQAARVAEELERIGAAYLAEGEIGRASELLSEAYALDDSNGLVLAELTLCHLRVADFDAARFYLRLAEERVNRAPPEIYATLGDAYFALHRLADAVSAWEEFLRFGGTDPVVMARLARAREELALSRGQRQLALERFAIFADAGVPEETLERAGSDLERLADRQAELLGRRLSGRQVVVLYAGHAYFALTSVPDWSSGLYDGKIRVSVEPGAPAEALAAVLSHELAHALLRQACGDRAPAWFHEGLSQWCEGRRLPVSEVRAAVGPTPAVSLASLDRTFARRLSRAAARASYAQALSLVEYLIATRGAGTVACVLDRVGEGGLSFADALRAESGLSESELFAGWQRWSGV